MKNRAVVILTFIAISSHAQNINKNSYDVMDSLINAEKIKLKNNAFCACLNNVYPELSKKLNDGSAAGYFETSAYSVDAFVKMDSLVTVYVKSKIYKSKGNKNLGIQKCLDFYNSKELESLIILFDEELDKSKLKIKNK